MDLLAEEVAKAKSETELGQSIKPIAEKAGIKPKELFEAAYLLLLGKARGPRLAGFLLSLESDFVVKRLRREK